jgi:GT2 family glycosyltransferase/glycosyltransferase involved in cell wall biosynthesis
VKLFRPLDWSRGAGRPHAGRPQSVDIIVPIHGAAEELRLCLDSVAAHTDLARHRVILVVDGPQDVPDFAGARILRNEQRLGFAASVNRGMSASTSDVVLLNSDTIVTAGWLEKLIDAAYSHGDIGTVTPLSNNATLCSVPRAFEENLIPDIASFAAHVESVSARAYPRLPTGVGFCLYIRRALVDDIGLFDAQRFGDGYGEENDFCMRALARGWLHVADDATFIHHAGHRSFGASRASRQRRARRALSRRHWRYMATIAEFMRRDPLAPVRARLRHPERSEGSQDAHSEILRSAQDDGDLRIVHLVHGWPPFQHAGTELYAYWLVRRQRDAHHVAVYARGADPSRADGEAVEMLDGGARVRLVTNHFTARNPLRRNAIRDRALERDFERFLRSESPDLLHVHHLAGHAFSLVHVARRLGIPIVMQLQDWWFLCARVNLFHRDGVRCSGPAPAKCASCATMTRVPLLNRLVHRVRRAAARAALRACDAFVAGSEAIRRDYASIVPRATPFHVIPYGVACGTGSQPVRRRRRPLRFGFVGSLLPHKGVHVAQEAMRGIDPSEAVLRVWGGGTTFSEEDKPRVFAEMDVLLVPSIGLESFGLAAREAMAFGVPVIASAGGALDELPEAELFPPGDTAALRAIIRRLIDDPAIIDEWSARLPQPKSDAAHAEEIERVYRAVLAR